MLRAALWERRDLTPVALHGSEQRDIRAAEQRTHGCEEGACTAGHVLIADAPHVRVLDDHNQMCVMGAREVRQRDEPAVWPALPAALLQQRRQVTAELACDLCLQSVQG